MNANSIARSSLGGKEHSPHHPHVKTSGQSLLSDGTHHGHRSHKKSSASSIVSDKSHVSHQQRQHHDHDQNKFFVVPRGVILEYGPYTFHGVTDFRVERLQGIQKSLHKMGARVKMLPCTDFTNRVQLWYMDSVIFTCKITDLNHGGDGEMDVLCMQAAQAFDKASRKAIHGLRHRISVQNQDLLDPFCPCINPHFFGPPPKKEVENDPEAEVLDKEVSNNSDVEEGGERKGKLSDSANPNEQLMDGQETYKDKKK